MKASWVTTKVLNMDQTIAFYEDILGLNCVRRLFLDDKRELAFIDAKSILLEFVCNYDNKELDLGKDISVGLTVDNLDEWLDYFKKEGIEIDKGPIEAVGGVRFFYILDPNGLRLQIFEEANVVKE